MRVKLLTMVLACLLAGSAHAGARAVPRVVAAEPPPGAVSDNVTFLANIPEMRTAIAVAFDGDLMLVSATTGLYAYSIADPAAPSLLGALPMYIWQNEDMDIDRARKRVFLSRDPRGFTTPASPGALFPYGAVHIVDYSNPHALTQVGAFTLPAGHTSTCVNDCDYLWTGGPYRNAQTQPAEWVGRPIFATDVRDPLNPVPCPEPIDLGRNDGITDYAHDVQVDAKGVAWVSGGGGVRGYWTSGEHRNPLTGEVETATACEPIPYGGGGTPSEATPSRFMHNSWRDLDAAIPGDPASTGMVLYATEENVTSACASSGRFATYDLRGSLDGEGWRSTVEEPFRMTVLDTWTPEAQPGSTGCASAHYFSDNGDGLLAHAFYGQGTRFLDVADPRDITQVGYYRPDGGNAWAAYWHGDLVVVPDNSRGIDILRFEGGSTEVTAPPLPVGQAAVPAPMDPTFGYLCPL